MKLGEEGVGIVELKQVEQKEKRKREENAPTCVNRLYHGRLK